MLAAGLTMMASIGHGATIVDTGQPTGETASPVGLTIRAGAFTVSSGYIIRDAQVFMLTFSPSGAMTMSIYADSNGFPGAELFSSEFMVVQSAMPTWEYATWQGVGGMNWQIDPGTYWIAIDKRGLQSAIGVLPFGDSITGSFLPPNPLAREANRNPSVGEWTESFVRRGWRVFGEPVKTVSEPGGIAMFGLGLLGLAVVRRRRVQ